MLGQVTQDVGDKLFLMQGDAVEVLCARVRSQGTRSVVHSDRGCGTLMEAHGSMAHCRHIATGTMSTIKPKPSIP